MRLHNKHKILSYIRVMGAVLALSLGSSQASQVLTSQILTSQILTLAENKRLEIAISADSMNRIAVMGDRIAQVFGDEGTFVSQADENTGQLFIKPSPENGTTPLSITLITENGVTQDLILRPTAKSATTTVFNTSVFNTSVLNPRVFSTGIAKNALKQDVFKEALSPMGDYLQQTLPFQEQLLLIMRQLVGGQLMESEGKMTHDRSSPEGYELEYSKSYQTGSYSALYSAQVFSVQNITSTAIELLEKSFYCAGDLALSFEKRLLMPGEKAHLFVVRSL